MDDEASAQPQPPLTTDEPAPARAAGASAPERYGTLQLERLAKDDGRALLIYARASGERA